MNKYTTPIPAIMYTYVREAVAEATTAPHEVRISAFPGDNGEQMFCIDVKHSVIQIVPTDGRQKPHWEHIETSIYFDANGERKDEQTMSFTHRGL